MNTYNNQRFYIILSDLKQVYLSITLFFLFFLYATSAAHAQDQLVLQRITGKIVLDGLINEKSWEDIEPIPVVMHIPNFGQEPSERTEILIAYDDEYLYVAGRLYDSEPGGIQSPSKRRDETGFKDDWFGFILDTYNDNENGLSFFTTPMGLRTDLAIKNDGSSFQSSWNTFWDVATSKDDKGWYAEFRIPFSSLRFQNIDGNVVMGLISFRFIARKYEFIIFPEIPPDWGLSSIFKVSKAREIVFKNIKHRNPLYITPYILGGLGKSFDLNENETAYEQTDERILEGGLDVKIGLTSNLTMDVTLNTDFAQVEADDQQINLTRFSLFFPEKRLFFQERSSIFDFSFGGPIIFHSRKIGIHEGKPVRILGGARLVGRLGSWDVGFMDMQTERSEELPSENFGILRLRKRVINPYSYVGGILTNRMGTDGSFNTVYGLDGIFKMSGEDYFLLNWGQSFEKYHDNNPASMDLSRFRIGWERRTVKGVGLVLNVVRRGLDFNPGMGFEMLENYQGVTCRLTYGWLPGEQAKLQSHYILEDGYVILRNEDNSIMTSNIGMGWGFRSRSGANGKYSIFVNHESHRDTFSLSDDVEVPVGEYTFLGFKGNYQTPPGDLLQSNFSIESGEYYDGYRFSLRIEPDWSATQNINLSGFYEYNFVNFPKRCQRLTAHIFRFKILAMLNTALTASAFIQYNSATSVIISNFRLRFNPREGNDFYLVYNENLNTDRYREIPTLPLINHRTLLVKYSYTFNL